MQETAILEKVVEKALGESVQPIIQMIAEHYAEIMTKPYLTLSEAAARVGCSEIHFLNTYAKQPEVLRSMRKGPNKEMKPGRRSMYLTETFDLAILDVLERIN